VTISRPPAIALSTSLYAKSQPASKFKLNKLKKNPFTLNLIFEILIELNL